MRGDDLDGHPLIPDLHWLSGCYFMSLFFPETPEYHADQKTSTTS
jgi:hypothetical protein